MQGTRHPGNHFPRLVCAIHAMCPTQRKVQYLSNAGLDINKPTRVQKLDSRWALRGKFSMATIKQKHAWVTSSLEGLMLAIVHNFPLKMI